MAVDLNYLIKNYGDGNSLPPVDTWHPTTKTDIDILIDRNGVWFHEGEEIRRKTMTKLFSSILKKEEDDYFLVTPAEKCRITVEDVPFMVLTLVEPANKIPFFVTQTDDVILIDQTFSSVLQDFDGLQLPYFTVRKGLLGRASRHLYYQLANHASARVIDSNLCLTLNGQSINLGTV